MDSRVLKRLIEHGTLEINAGRKTLIGPDQHQQRAKAKVRDSLESASRRVANKSLELEAKREWLAESEAKGHGKRLEQRQDAAAQLEEELGEVKQCEAQLQERVDRFEAPKEWADRDGRKQTMMTIRTLFLENMLQNCMAVLLSMLPNKVSLEKVLKLLFECSGSRIEKDQMATYWVNTAGLSLGNRRVLDEIVEGLNAMGLVGGTPVCVDLKDLPP